MLSLWIDLRHTKNEEMRIGWAVMTLRWHATWKTGIWCREQHAVYTNTRQTRRGGSGDNQTDGANVVQASSSDLHVYRQT